jgi:hypothetical protein
VVPLLAQQTIMFQLSSVAVPAGADVNRTALGIEDAVYTLRGQSRQIEGVANFINLIESWIASRQIQLFGKFPAGDLRRR